MYILTNLDIPKDLVSVFDSSDGTNEVIRLSVLASKITSRKIKVYGLGSLAVRSRADIVPIEHLGIYVCNSEAREALATVMTQRGVQRSEAKRRAGL